MLSGLGLSEEAHRALVTGTQSHPHSPSLWLQRLKCEVGEGGGERDGERGDVSLTRLKQLCSEAIEKIPQEVASHKCICTPCTHM